MNNTILVTDDNVLDNAIVRNYLHNKNYNLISALNGQEALDLIESRNVDLILLDLVMPVMDGYEFLVEFSKTNYYSEIPVIVTTSIDSMNDIEKILEFEVFDYITKPLDHINRLIFLNKIKTAIKYRDLILQLKKSK
ncbi:response regulator [Herbivorax sp. ANBcel31]|uniref:response regulator n=1 Tax=Herbivorax sp. ANBcel31 TaxID=3069754 RepID=UPI0027B22C75|nr:response regulator [Herbivorax sp. ANBcel31]MDQ2085266.1 response regulator [Herbivorax sp. ANBcel31]